jgi:hypothetical protein
MKALINNYYLTGTKLVGTMGENDLGYRKGRFFSVEYTKALTTVVYDALGIKYELGTKGTAPIGELFKQQLEALTFGIESGSALDKAQEIALKQFGASEAPVEVSSTQYKTCKVTTYEWNLLGRRFNLQQRTSGLTSELVIK